MRLRRRRVGAAAADEGARPAARRAGETDRPYPSHAAPCVPGLSHLVVLARLAGRHTRPWNRPRGASRRSKDWRSGDRELAREDRAERQWGARTGGPARRIRPPTKRRWWSAPPLLRRFARLARSPCARSPSSSTVSAMGHRRECSRRPELAGRDSSAGAAVACGCPPGVRWPGSARLGAAALERQLGEARHGPCSDIPCIPEPRFVFLHQRSSTMLASKIHHPW
jgi:hypothetical protein